MGKIVLLDDLTINKIAAGEVVERPASVVKEMVENSIDAGAKNVTVEIKNGGISLIKIIDDGCGLAEDDMEIAFERHATSKIRKADDLETVTTMGFRGEALASVAAISKIEMISKRPEDEIGHRLVIEGGKVLEKSEVGAPNGTQITVKNLFFNTPVRYKFLKKDFTEAGYIEDAISRLALVNKDVSIKLINTGKTVIQTNGKNDIKSVIYGIYGKDIANGVTEVDYTFEDMKVTGVIGKKDIARSNRNGQIFFVNNRYVKDKNLSAAVEQAYKGILPTGKYGFVILNLEMDPKKVDVNVHPAKLEVRFEEESNVFKAIYHAIKSGLAIFDVEENANHTNNVMENQEKIADNNETDLIKPDENDKVEEMKPKTNAFSGFFKKILAEKEETKEELENNSIREIFESRNERKYQNLSDDNFTDSSNTLTNNKQEYDDNNVDDQKEKNIKDDNFAAKTTNKPSEVMLGNTIISSDTMESDYQINDILKNATVKIDTTKVLGVDSNSKTEIMDSLKKIEDVSNQETKVLRVEENDNSENIEPNLGNGENTVDKIKDDEKEKNEKSLESVTEKILKQKIELDIDDTQFIDTNKVREGLAASKEETPVTPEFADMYKKVFGMEVSDVRKNKEEENQKMDVSISLQPVGKEENLNVFDNVENMQKNTIPQLKYRFVGTIFNTYAIIEVKDEMYMIEQSAAEERLMYEKIKVSYEADNKDSQMLLLADVITLTGKEMGMARDLIDMFRKVGFDYEEFGETTLKLTTVPSWAESMNTKKLFLEILNDMDFVAVTEIKEKEDKFISSVASSAVKQSDAGVEELEEIIKELLKLPSPFIYPNGKLTAIKITRANMEKKFSRR